MEFSFVNQRPLFYRYLLWLYLLILKLLVYRLDSAIITIVIQGCTLIVATHWWHSTITAVTSLIFLLSTILLIEKLHNVFFIVSFSMSLAIFSLCKPNVAGPLIFLLCLFLIIDNKLRSISLLSIFISLVFSLGFLILNNVNIIDLLKSYLFACGRIFPDKYFLAQGWNLHIVLLELNRLNRFPFGGILELVTPFMMKKKLLMNGKS